MEKRPSLSFSSPAPNALIGPNLTRDEAASFILDAMADPRTTRVEVRAAANGRFAFLQWLRDD